MAHLHIVTACGASNQISVRIAGRLVPTRLLERLMGRAFQKIHVCRKNPPRVEIGNRTQTYLQRVEEVGQRGHDQGSCLRHGNSRARAERLVRPDRAA